MVIVKGNGGEEWRDIAGWIAYYKETTGELLSRNTIKKRRAASGLGQVAAPKTILLTLEEFKIVLGTPLPGCSSITGPHRRVTRVTCITPSGSKE